MYLSYVTLALAMLAAQNAVGENATLPENPIFKELVERGVTLSDGKAVKLPQPIMGDNLDAAAQWAAIEKISDARHPAKDLVENSRYAPVMVKVRTVRRPKGEGPAGRAVDLWFVAHGDWDILTSKKFLESAMKTSPGPNNVVAKSGALTDQEMANRDLKAADRDGYEERFLYSTFSMFDRVELSMTRRAVLVRAKDSILAAGKIDRRFDKDPDYPNQWRPLVRDAQANIQPGPPHPFDRAGGYAKITRLVSPAGAAFIECHLVYEEDYGWFNGVNMVKQKAPAMIQEKVRSFRRKLNVATLNAATAKKGGKK